MREPIEHEYFNWLCAKVVESSLDCNLLRILHQTEFVWVVPADSHRASDGIELRSDFRRETNNELDELWEAVPCSLLEFLIAFAKRAQFQTDIPAKDLFWTFLANLHLDDYRFQADIDYADIEDILHTFIWRTYDPRGFGGLFPLPETEKDQREVEIWYQFSEWVIYQGLI